MRKLRWPIAIFVFLIAVLGALSMRKESDPYREFRPFIVSDKTEYHREVLYAISPPPVHFPATVVRTILVKGGDQDKLLDFLKARARTLALPSTSGTEQGIGYITAIASVKPWNQILGY